MHLNLPPIWHLVQVFIRGSLRIETVEGVEGTGRKMLKVMRKQRMLYTFVEVTLLSSQSSLESENRTLFPFLYYHVGWEA